MLREILIASAAVLLVAAMVLVLNYQKDIRAVRGRVLQGSRMIETKRGPIDYATMGEGPPVLVVHGAGGGYDQGILMARMLVGDGFRFITPSRFGYLRTPLPANASAEAQADAHACLLDALNINKVAVVGVSAGAPSSMQFALRYPDRISALVLLVPAAWAPKSPQAERKFPVPTAVYEALFGSDFLMWLMMKTALPSLESAFGVSPEVLERLMPAEKEDLSDLVQALLPVSLRKAGIHNDGAVVDSLVRYSLENITVPTLVISAADDKVAPFGWGKYTAENIPDAKFILLESGGHFLAGQHTRVRAAVSEILKKHRVSEAREGR